MSEQNSNPSILPLRNVAAMVALTDQIHNRDYNLPGMGVFYGPSGWGKTSAATITANEYNAHWVQCKSVWSPKFFCQAILKELGVTPRKHLAEMVDQIGVSLMRSDRPLLIDDAQYLRTSTMVNLIRDIYESCQTTIILIGEEELPQHLSKWENVHNRILSWVAAEPCDLTDAQCLADAYVADTTIGRDLLHVIVDASGGSFRRVAVNLSRVREMARGRGVDHMTLSDWGDRKLDTGQPPAARGPLVRRIGRATPNEQTTVLKQVIS